MEADAELIRNAARLIALGLMPARRPSQDPEYNALIRRFQDEPLFQRVVRDVAQGLGLRLLDVSEFGATLSPLPDSPFGLTLADYLSGLSAEDRVLHGLIQVGLAAWLFPRAEDLEEEALTRPVTAAELDAFLREACTTLAARNEEADPPAEVPELVRAYRLYRERPSVKETTDGRRASKTTQALIAASLERLAEAGLLRRVNDKGGGTYHALRRYRVQVRELAGHEVLRALRSLRSP
jgi:hypothetical protein